MFFSNFHFRYNLRDVRVQLLGKVRAPRDFNSFSKWRLKITLFFLFLFGLVQSICAGKVNRVLPGDGSLAGGTMLILEGEGMFVLNQDQVFVSWFRFSSFHFITVQRKIQYGDKLCFEFPSIMTVEKGIQSKITKFIINVHNKLPHELMLTLL